MPNKEQLNEQPEKEKQLTEEEICGSVGRIDTAHLTNLVSDFTKLYGTSVSTKVANDAKVNAEKRLIQAIKANLDRYDA